MPAFTIQLRFYESAVIVAAEFVLWLLDALYCACPACREEGLLGLWKGLGPNVARNAIINAAELASYDQIKQSLLATGVFKDNVGTHLAAGVGAGFFAVCIGSPVDVVKSRIMGKALKPSGGVPMLCFCRAGNVHILPAYAALHRHVHMLFCWCLVLTSVRFVLWRGIMQR